MGIRKAYDLLGGLVNWLLGEGGGARVEGHGCGEAGDGQEMLGGVNKCVST